MSDSRPAGADGAPIGVSRTSTRANRTGSWRYTRPVFRDRVAPCNAACPVGADVEGCMNYVREGRLEVALELLLRENPIPAVTGRVCHHPCEQSCHRRRHDEAVSVHAVERALGDVILERGTAPEPLDVGGGGRVAVVGSGPAGLSCAYHLSRLGHEVTVLEADDAPGGMLRQGIPEYRLPRELLDRQIHWLEERGIEFRCGVRVGRDVRWGVLDGYDAAFLATGAHGHRSLGLPGEELQQVRPGLDFLKEVNRGGRPDLGRRVAVIGGGNTAVDCARTAVRLGASALVLYRRTEEQMPAIAQEVAEARREGVEFRFLASPTGFVGGGERLLGVECQRMRLGEPDASGRPRPVPRDHGQFCVAADSVLLAVGETAETAGIPLEEGGGNGAIASGTLGGASRPGWYAGGDAAGEERTVADALGSGKRAALGIDRRLRRGDGKGDGKGNGGGEDLAAFRFGEDGNLSAARWAGDDPVRRSSPVNRVVEWERLNPAHFLPAERNPDRHLPPEEARSGFEEVNRGLSPQRAVAEARRCFNCAVCNDCDLCLIFCPDAAVHRRDGEGLEIDLDYCKGCGVCAVECPRGAITMEREAAT